LKNLPLAHAAAPALSKGQHRKSKSPRARWFRRPQEHWPEGISLCVTDRTRHLIDLICFHSTSLFLLAGSGIYRFYWQQILAAKEIYLPRILPKAVDQKMGFCTASDGVHIAYASSGKGSPLVIMIGWVTHLERGFLSPAYFGNALRGFGAHHLLVRYDTRGSPNERFVSVVSSWTGSLRASSTNTWSISEMIRNMK
jgi:hypothetical protein